MQALILAGGEGTRLRPLTLTVPKPVVPIVERPHLARMADWLRRFDVDDIVLACGHMADGIRAVAGDGSAFGTRIRYVEEPEPRGTGGAVKEAEELLDERFLVLNGDILADLDLAPLIAHHEQAGAAATIGLIPVEDPSAYGVVVTAGDGSVEAFIEKPKREEAPTNLINAGVYVMERSVLGSIEADRNVSIERETFPALTGNGLHALEVSGYWLDIGTPERYLQAHRDLLEGTPGAGVGLSGGAGGVTLGRDARLEGEANGPVWIGDGATVEAGAAVGPNATVGAGCTIAAGARIAESVLLDGVSVGAGAKIHDAVIASNAQIGEGASVGPDAVVGAGAVVTAGTVLEAGARIAPEES